MMPRESVIGFCWCSRGHMKLGGTAVCAHNHHAITWQQGLWAHFAAGGQHRRQAEPARARQQDMPGLDLDSRSCETLLEHGSEGFGDALSRKVPVGVQKWGGYQTKWLVLCILSVFQRRNFSFDIKTVEFFLKVILKWPLRAGPNSIFSIGTCWIFSNSAQ